MTAITATSAGSSNPLAAWLARNGPVLAIVVVIFATWEIAVRALNVPDYILPSPWVIAAKIVISWHLLLVNAFVTFQEILLGFGESIGQT